MASGGYSLLRCVGFLLWWLLLLRSTGSKHMGFRSCNAWAQWLRQTGLVAPWHMGSSRTRDWTSVPCVARQILNHWTTEKAPAAAAAAAAANKSLQSCLTLCDPIDGSLPGSSVPGIFQARILEWVAISFNACMLSRFSCVGLCLTPWTAAHQAPMSTGFSRQECWSGLPCLPPGGLPNPGDSIHVSCISCIGRQVLYHQCHVGSPSL